MIDVAEHPATTKRRIAPYLLVGRLSRQVHPCVSPAPQANR